MDRRKFLEYSATSVGLLSLGNTQAFSQQVEYKKEYIYEPERNYSSLSNKILPNSSSNNFWDQPRKVSLYRKDTGENAELIYFKDGGINQEHYWLASYLLRDIHQKKMVYMDLKLLDLVCAVQSWIKYFGFNGALVVNSGYRTLATNSALEGAAKNSMHLQGKAIDFTVPGLNVKDIAKIATHFRGGGVGIYPSRNFIHLDTGGVRTWTK